MKLFNTITDIVDTGLITSTVIAGEISIAVFASGVGLPLGITLSGTSLLLSLATVITGKYFKTFTLKQEKHYSIKLITQSKLEAWAILFCRQFRTEISHLLKFIKYCRR